MKTPDEDRMLDEYLAGRSEVTQRYAELADEELPVGLDERILARATDAVRSTLRPAARRSHPWHFGLATAIVLALAVGLVLESGVLRAPSPPSSDRADAGASRDAELESKASADEAAARAPQSVPRSAGSSQFVAEPPAGDSDALGSQGPASRARVEGSEVRNTVPLEDAGVDEGAVAGRDEMPASPALSGVAMEGTPPPAAAPVKDPQVWLAEIVALREGRRPQDAAAELERFREVYPHYPVPETLSRRP